MKPQLFFIHPVMLKFMSLIMGSFSGGFLIVIVAIIAVYLFFALLFTFLVHRLPRNPVTDPPDWGEIIDTRIPTVGGGFLEVYRVSPDCEPVGTIVIAHGWGRNRDRMMARARVFGKLGYITVLHSARDHGNSSKKLMMNTVCFAEDIEAVLKWVEASSTNPVLLYGHSAGSGGSALAASRNPEKIKMLFLEGSFPDTREARLSLYRWFNPVFGYLIGPAIVFFASLYFRISWPKVSPGVLARQISCPTMVIHGAKDPSFPVSFAPRLRACFKHVPTAMFIAPNAGHSDSSQDPGFEPAIRRFVEEHA